jgi:endonuclease/exonuclease/phosphatase family metal-dependent hydrolase
MIEKVAAFLLFFLAPVAGAVGLRVATFNVGANLVVPTDGGPAYFDYGIGSPGQVDHDRVAAILDRIDADVVALQEIHAADVAGMPDDLDALAATLGYPYSYVSPSTNTFDTSLKVVFLSRYPLVNATAVGSPVGAKEMTRLIPAVKVDVPGTTRDPLLMSVHLKSGTATADRFRRAVELRRLREYLSATGLTADDNFIVMGDFNLSSINTTFTTLPPSLPSTFALGSEITLPLAYSTNPLTYFSNPSVVKLDPRQVNNSPVTFGSSSTIDLFLVSAAIAGRPLASEIYNSALDVSNGIGLAKAGSPLPAATSVEASDHLALFADVELDADYPNLALSLSAATATEGVADGAVTATVTLPAARGTAVTVGLSSDGAGVVPVSPTLTIPAGGLTGTMSLKISRNFIQDPQRSVTLTAAATGYDPASQVLAVNDADGPYEWTAAGQTIREDFSGFLGTYTPAPWISSGGAWQGVDSGIGTAGGFRAYGSASDPALGFLPSGGAGSAMATYVNFTSQPLTAVQISYTAEQWRAAQGGTVDILTADLLVNGVPRALPQLTYSPSTQLATGAVAGGVPSARTTRVTGLNIAPGASFNLRFTMTPGAGGGVLPADVFVNEFHYDNNGTDTGEFIEVVVGPGFSGNLADVDVLLYDGNDGSVYRTLNLATAFTLGASVPVAGSDRFFRIFSVDTSGIQNGPDGIAVINKTTVQLYQFLSYEGSFASTATGVPAIPVGTLSTNIGVFQSVSEAVGQSALGLVGTGAVRTDFTWMKISGAYSKGQLNAGQSFNVPTLPSQGVAVDQISVTFLGDSDGDGILDVDDVDDDNDGTPDGDELVFGTDPLVAGPRFTPTLVNPGLTPGVARVSFFSVIGRSYRVESSVDLRTWTALQTYAGTGAAVVVDYATSPLDPQRFYRILVTLP